MQVADPQRAALDPVQTRFTEHGYYVGEFDMTMTVKVREMTFLFPCSTSKVNGQYSSARF